MPEPEPTPEQIETVREMARLSSLSYTASLVGKLMDEQWAAQLVTNVIWLDRHHDDVRIGGRVQINPEEFRQLLTDETRIRLGLSPLYGVFTASDLLSSSTPTKVVY